MAEHDVNDALHRKVPFEWRPHQVPVEFVFSDHVTWADATDERFAATAGRALAASLQEEDVATVARHGLVGAGVRLLEAPGEWHFSSSPSWWSLLLLDGEAAAFVMPTAFDDVPEPLGTIFHMGVDPAFRGRGLGRHLLRRTVDVLSERGIERIFCDTNEANAPMIRTFEVEGWHRLPVREVPVVRDFESGDGRAAE